MRFTKGNKTKKALSSERKAAIRRRMNSKVQRYLDKEVAGCSLIPKAEQASLVIRIQCVKNQSKLKLRASFVPMVITHPSKGLKRRGGNHAITSPWVTQHKLIYESKDAIWQTFARDIARRLHTLYPHLIYPPEYPRTYETIYLRIGKPRRGRCAIKFESVPGRKQILLDQRLLKALDPLQDLANHIAGVAVSDSLSAVAQGLLPTDQDAEPSDAEYVRSQVAGIGNGLCKWLGRKVTIALRNRWRQWQRTQPREGLRLRLCCADPRIMGLPWEYLRLPFGAQHTNHA